MSAGSKFTELFSNSSLEEIYKSHIMLSGATGIDKVTHRTFAKSWKQQIKIVSTKALDGSYKFSKYKLKLVSKGRGKPPREISIPTIRDRIALRALCGYLTSVFEDDITFELPQKVVGKLKDALTGNKYDSFIKLDVKSFYPSIDQSLLMNALGARIGEPEILKMVDAALRTPTVEKSKLGDEPNNKGVPQGLSISNILAAIYLASVDECLRNKDPLCQCR